MGLGGGGRIVRNTPLGVSQRRALTDEDIGETIRRTGNEQSGSEA